MATISYKRAAPHRAGVAPLLTIDYHAQFCCNFFPPSAFPLSIFVTIPATFEENGSLFHRLDQLFRLHVVIDINYKKYIRAAIGRVAATSYDVIRRAASKSTDDVDLIKRS
jgi:hypothetical protein